MSSRVALGFGFALAADFGHGIRKASMRRDEGLIPTYERTSHGCACTNQCGATAGHYFECDWCNVPSGCGEYNFLRKHYDFCSYEEDEDYTRKSAASKLESLWKEVIKSPTPGPNLLKLEAVPKILSKSMRTTFDNKRDTLPDGRPKHTHSNGVVCKFDLEIPSGSPYTGMLASGTHPGLIRLASARVPTEATFPGFAVKMLRSGIHSANFVTLRPTGQNGPKDFFAEPLSTHSAPDWAADILQKFQQATDCRSMLGISDFCKYDQDGRRVNKVQFPYELIFEAPDPKAFAVDKHAADPTAELLKQLSSIPSGTKIWKMYARSSPKASKKFLGSLRTTSRCTTSSFGDGKLFFRHQRMEEDFALRPDWIQDIDMPMCDGSARPSSEWQCPGVTGIPA